MRAAVGRLDNDDQIVVRHPPACAFEVDEALELITAVVTRSALEVLGRTWRSASERRRVSHVRSLPGLLLSRSTRGLSLDWRPT